ncbi:MAG: 4-hydroxy-3-methylbut-2-enyl diphosphate reductase [Bacteroidales bacterium]
MKIEIDQGSGFCFGVVRAITLAEKILKEEGRLYCLGDIVHNNKEVERLKSLGLEIIDNNTFKQLSNCKVLIRAHGEPPETYETAQKNSIELIDGTCPVVLKLQQKIKNKYNELKEDSGQVLIYGKKGHAEVVGLTGQTGNRAIVVESPEDLDNLDPSKPLHLFAQTTKSPETYQQIFNEIKTRYKASKPEIYLACTDSICRQVSTRSPRLKQFCSAFDVIIFVSGKKSSNGKLLFEDCKSVNQNSYFVSDKDELDKSWFENAQSVGICGATSTPKWLMEEVAESIKKLH